MHISVKRFAALVFLAALALVFGINTTPATAQTFYSDLAAYNAAATTATTYDFEGIAPASDFVANPDVLTIPAPGRVTFSVIGGFTQGVFAVDSNALGGFYRLSDASDSVSAGFPEASASTTTITLDDFYTAFAIEYGMTNNETNTFTFALFNGDTQVGTTFNAGSSGGDRFFGATSATAFDNVRVTAAIIDGTPVVFDNARVGSAGVAVVPEAGTFALLLPAMGALGLAVAARRRK